MREMVRPKFFFDSMTLCEKRDVKIQKKFKELVSAKVKFINEINQKSEIKK